MNEVMAWVAGALMGFGLAGIVASFAIDDQRQQIGTNCDREGQFVVDDKYVYQCQLKEIK